MTRATGKEETKLKGVVTPRWSLHTLPCLSVGQGESRDWSRYRAFLGIAGTHAGMRSPRWQELGWRILGSFQCEGHISLWVWQMSYLNTLRLVPPTQKARLLMHQQRPGRIHVSTNRNTVYSATQSCPTLCDAMHCSPTGSSVRGILQAKVLEWVAVSYSKKYNGGCQIWWFPRRKLSK